MGLKDMEGMTVSRADFWAVAKENLERGDKEEKERVSKAKLTYRQAKKRERSDPRKRKIGNAGISVASKKPSLETNSSTCSRVQDGYDDDEYSYMEEEELVDEREERWEEEDEERWREQQEEEEDYHYHDGDGLV